MSTSSELSSAVLAPQQALLPAAIAESIRQALEDLQFGHVTISVHDGQVVQIERVTKIRQFRAARSQP